MKEDNKTKDSGERKQRTLHERWSTDELPNVTPPTEKTLAWVAWFNEQENKADPKKEDSSELLINTSIHERWAKSSQEEGGGVGFTPNPNPKKVDFIDLRKKPKNP